MSHSSSSPLRVGIISQWFFPEPVPIPKSMSQALVDRGHSVRVLTGFPSYPFGQIYAGYEDNEVTEETISGARVMRVPTFLSHDLNALHRLRSFLSFGAQSLRRSAFLRHSDVNYVYATPMTASTAALVCRWLWKTPFVLHIQDLWPESITDSGMMPGGWRKSLINVLIGWALWPAYFSAAQIIVISPGMKRALIARGVDEKKVTVVYNWDGNERLIDAEISSPSPQRDPHTLHCVYAGNIGQMQDVETIVRAAATVENELDLRVSLYGSGVAEPSVAALIKNLGVKNVQLLGRVAPDKMQAIYEESDFQFVTLKDFPLFRMTIPSKFQASLANGVPVITTVKGDLADLCVDNELGFVAEPEDVAGLADAIRKAAGMGRDEHTAMSKRAQDFYRANMSTDVAVNRISTRLAETVRAKRRTTVPERP